MERLIPLGSAGGSDPSAVGAKAAGLSDAKLAGLPVLPGWVLPPPAAVTAIRLDLREPGPAEQIAASRAAESLHVDAATLRDLALVAHRSSRTSVVRSSTPMDDDGRWAGAFATYHDVDRSILPLAVRGCWASAFSPDVRARRRHLGAGHVMVGVLIQPWVAFAVGGTAEVLADGEVLLSSSPAGPAGIVDGRVRGEPPPLVIAEAARDLASAVVLRTGCTRIEWGWRDGEMWLLQVGTPGTRRSSGTTPAPIPVEPRLLGIARTVARYRAPLGDRLVVPWALAGEPPAPPAPIRTRDVARSFAEACALADRLAADAWGRPPAEALRRSAAVARGLLGPDPAEGAAALPDMREVDRPAAARLLGLIAGIGEEIAADGVIDHPEQVWRLEPAALRAAVEHGSPAHPRGGPDRWEPFVAGVVAAAGRPASGTSVAAGIGAGRLHVVEGPTRTMPPPRTIIAARAPVPQLAPLLFAAAGVVTAGGAMGAHLFEVARSLGIPGVAGIDLAGTGDAVVAVDGDRSIVSVLADASEPARTVVEVG